MKILMFGWEFPPHISGGLGTACFGLTESLGKSDTQILFVISKADVKTVEDGPEIINASNVLIPVRSDALNQQQPIQRHLGTEPTGNDVSTDAVQTLYSLEVRQIATRAVGYNSIVTKK